MKAKTIESKVKKYRIYMLNFDYFLDGEYDSIEAAIAKSKSTTFETTIYDESNKMVASYSFFGGTRYYR